MFGFKSYITQNIFSLFLQPSQPLPGILHLSNTRISVLPEGEEFLVMLYGFDSLASYPCALDYVN